MKAVLFLVFFCGVFSGCFHDEISNTNSFSCKQLDNQVPAGESFIYEGERERFELNERSIWAFEKVDNHKGFLSDDPFRVLEMDQTRYLYFLENDSSKNRKTYTAENADGEYLFTVVKGKTPYVFFYNNSGYGDGFMFFIIYINGDLYAVDDQIVSIFLRVLDKQKKSLP